jgi:3-hydroxyisobutyrate dehydrogenase-like beta-hydroxyacid dehydrogenase
MPIVNVAFLGLGTMGAPMAHLILAAGYRLTVWNRSPARAAPLVARGARAAASPAEAAQAAELVITMLADEPAVAQVIAGARGVTEGLAAGALVVDMSTVGPGLSRRMAEVVRARGGAFIDAPVAGTRAPAEKGALLVLAGGAAADVARARPVLEAMGDVWHLGEVGRGAAMKLVLNGVGAHMMAGLGALLCLGAAHGLEARTMLDVIQASAFFSPLYGAKGKKILARDFSADFTLALMLKDQELVLDAARAASYPMPTEQTVRDLLAAATAAGLGDGDLCGLVRHFEALAKTTIS